MDGNPVTGGEGFVSLSDEEMAQWLEKKQSERMRDWIEKITYAIFLILLALFLFGLFLYPISAIAQADGSSQNVIAVEIFANKHMRSYHLREKCPAALAEFKNELCKIKGVAEVRIHASNPYEVYVIKEKIFHWAEIEPMIVKKICIGVYGSECHGIKKMEDL